VGLIRRKNRKINHAIDRSRGKGRQKVPSEARSDREPREPPGRGGGTKKDSLRGGKEGIKRARLGREGEKRSQKGKQQKDKNRKTTAKLEKERGEMQ